MDEILEGKVFNGCLECGEESTEEWERHKPTCPQVDRIMAQMSDDE